MKQVDFSSSVLFRSCTGGDAAVGISRNSAKSFGSGAAKGRQCQLFSTYGDVKRVAEGRT